jgi:hypothetical protein
MIGKRKTPRLQNPSIAYLAQAWARHCRKRA